MSEYFITTFYKFVEIPRESLTNLRSLLLDKGSELNKDNELNICGLLLLGVEGCNATIAGPEKSLKEFCDYLMSLPEIGALEFKNSKADKKPFRRFKIDIREEIVTIKNSDLLPQTGKNNHLSPQEWQAVLDSEEDFVLIDTRNFYETDVGVFKDAIDLRLKKFSDFGDKVRALNIDKKKKVLMYCTGGIRCEKAILEMQSDGFENVFQLEGGILKYLEELPNKSFEGECFVFDHRVSVDQVLQPSQKYKLCPHCGNPALQEISCKLCGTEKKVCRYCLEKEELNTCSKNCAHHYQRKMGKILSAA